jgi:hypothetical protein
LQGFLPIGCICLQRRCNILKENRRFWPPAALPGGHLVVGSSDQVVALRVIHAPGCAAFDRLAASPADAEKSRSASSDHRISYQIGGNLGRFNSYLFGGFSSHLLFLPFWWVLTVGFPPLLRGHGARAEKKFFLGIMRLFGHFQKYLKNNA